MIARESIVAAARGWIGTPYHHQASLKGASLKGAGCDCLGLIRGVWREVRGPEPVALPPYTRDWGDATGSQPLLEAADRHLVKVAVGEAKPGHVIVFRMRAGVAKHAGLLVRYRPPAYLSAGVRYRPPASFSAGVVPPASSMRKRGSAWRK